MTTRKLVVLAIVCVLALTVGCKSGGGGGGDDDWGNNNDSTSARVFDITDHELLVGEKECYLTHVEAGWNLPDIVEVCGYYIGADDEIMDYEHVYGAAFYTTNDHANTRYMYVEIYDQNHTLVNDVKAEFIINGQPIDAILIPYFITWLEEEDRGKVFTVDVWIRDADGVESPVYTFDIAAVQ